ncbi:MAG: right-handed parallel beta-helix repeat-containing protein, partial [Candidatus Thermoplasmatota archaeon]|nr:right-handed parallel beta-helix repeat-containing protein [Candidatus Thermoplasmatota archaeon]
GEGYEFVSGENMTLALEDSQALGNDNTGVYISSENDLDLIFTNNKVNGNGEGVWIVVDRKMDLEVNGNDISENEENGLIAQSGHTADVQIIDNTVIQNEGIGIGLIAGGITTPVNGTIENLRSEENQLGLVVIYGGDLTMTGSHLIENEDVGLAILDSLFLIEEYEDGEIIETRARPSIEGNVINKNGDPEGPSGYGVYVENSFVKIADNEINDNWNHGIRLETTGEEWAVTVEGNTIMHNSYGIYSSGSFAEVNNNEITYNRKQDDGAGIYLMDTELELLNNQIYNNLNYGIQIENDGGDLSHSRTDWTVTDEALVKNNPIMFRGNLDVESGSFTLENVNGFYMISQLNNRFGITVNSEFHSYNSNIQPHHDDEAEVDEYDASFTFEVEDSLFTMVDSSVSGAHSLRLEGSEAIIHGTDISQGLYGGIEAYNSNMVLERTNITGTSTFGLYLEESSATFSRLAIKDSEIGIEAHESEFFGRKSEFDDIPYVGIKSNGTVFEMHECIINPSEYPSYDDFIMSGDSTGELYDVEVGNNPPYEYEVIMNDNTRLDVFWSVRVNVTDIYMDPVPYDTVEVYDGDGNHVTNLTTDHNGLTEYEYLKDRTITPASDAEAEVTYEEPYEFVSEETENTQIEEIGFSRTVKIMPGKEPVFVSEPSEEVLLGESYHYNAESIDPRNRPAKNLTFALDRKPDGMTIDPETGQITWKPTASQVGNHTVIVRVRNQNTSRYAVQEFEVEVIHEAPRIYSVLPWDEASEVDVNTNLSIDVESDIYPTVVEFYLDGELVYRKTIYEDGTVETDSLDLDRGETYEWEVVVTDGEGETTTEEYTLNTVDEEEGGILPLYGWIALVIIVALILLLVAMEWRKRQEKETPPEEEEVFEEEEIEEEEMFEEEEEMPMEEEEMFEEEEEEEIFEEPEETEEEMFEEEEGVEEETPPPPEEEEEV